MIMGLSNISSYVDKRLENQIAWYEKKATENKNMFHYLQVVIIVASAIIPLVNLIDIPLQTRVTSAILGAIITGITALTQLKKYQENWLLYRSTEESLKREKFLFLNNAGNYSNLADDVKSKTLVESIEAILSSETSRFFAMHQPRSSPEASSK
jgi:hypothetical protein